MEFDANDSVDEVIGIELDISPGVNDSEKPDSITNKKGFHVKKKRRETSMVWKYFTKDEEVVGQKRTCRCNKCGSKYICDTSHGTKNLLKHLQTCKKQRDLSQMMFSQSSGSLTMHASKFDPDKFRELVIKGIIKHDLPLKFVEYEGVRAILSYLHEEVKHISRNTAKSDVLNLYKKEKCRLKRLLESIPGRVNLTSDLWTSIATDGYLCLTAHFIDDDWRLQKRILNFCFMPPPHSGVAICERIYNLLVD